MGFAKYKQRIIKLKKLADTHPGRFRSRLVFIVYLGYFAVFLYFFSFAGLLAALILYSHSIPLRMIILFIILLVAVGRVFFQRIPPPTGLQVKQDKFPELYSLIQDAKQLTNGPDLHRIVINFDYNAAVIQIPRLWLLLGGYRNYLMIGLPLLSSLSPEEFKAVLCHEFGHLTKNHSKFQQQVMKVAMIWEILGELNFMILLLFYPFVKIYSPILEAYISVYQRSDEYEADQIAIKATGKEACAVSLWKVHVLGGYFEDNYEKILLEKAIASKEPDISITRLFQEICSIPIISPKLDVYREQQKKIQTAPWDTHPSLADRLKAMGTDIPEKTPEVDSVAKTLLYTPVSDSRGILDTLWIKENREIWTIVHETGKSAMTMIKRLDSKDRKLWTAEDALNYVGRMELFRDKSEIISLYEQFIASFPENLFLKLNYGNYLFELRDDNGMKYVKQAMKEPVLAMHAAEAATMYLHSAGRENEVEEIITEMENRMNEIGRALEKRAEVSAENHIVPHGLDKGTIERLVESLGDIRKHIAELYLMKKVDDTGRLMSVYLLVFKIKKAAFSLTVNASELTEQIDEAADLPFEYYAINLNSSRELKKRLPELSGDALIFSKKK